jgi:prepilin-type N-terminal cleavage/methylation domain-containing protein
MVPERLRVIGAAHGYTMAELVVVLAIIGILVALGVPTLSTYLRAAALRAGAEEAVSVLNGARQLAIQANTTVCVTNDGTQAQYHVGGCTAATWTGVGTDASGNIRMANQLRVGGSNNLCFNHLGAGTLSPAPCAANGTLTVTSPAGGPALTVVMATTGRLRIQ